jgi:thioredoxin reductase
MFRRQRYDTVIVGGSFAGLSAAIYLGRARRSVLVLDTDAPRNRFAAASHGFFAQDGADPRTMIATMRTQVAAYPTIDFLDQAATQATRQNTGFSVALANGDVVAGATLLLAYGITDILPDLPGVAERWGKSVLHCPYCHGYEFSGQRLGVLNLSLMSLHQATLIPEWGPTTFFLDGGEIDSEADADLTRRGVSVEPAPVEALIGEGSSLSAVRLGDGREHPLDALFISPCYHFSSDLAEQLGCAIGEGQFGSTVTVDEMKATSVAGVYAAGDITRMGHTVTFACADGVMAALAIHRSLAFGMNV